MGAGSSTLQAFPSDVSAKTADARDVVNKIFQYLLTQMKMQEYLPLANPDTCKNYVILMADSLEKYFQKMRYFPTQATGKSSYLYFRKLSDLQGVTPEVSRYCVAIAYFYVRIFQIFGALTLSILDADTQAFEMYFKGGQMVQDEEDEEENENENGIQQGGGERALTASEMLDGDYSVLNPSLRVVDSDTHFKFQGKALYIGKNPMTSARFGERYELIKLFQETYRKEDGRKITRNNKITALLSLNKIAKSGNINVELQDIQLQIRDKKIKYKDVHLLFYRRGDVEVRYESQNKNIPDRIDSVLQVIYKQVTDKNSNDENEEREENRRDRRGDYDYRYPAKDKGTWDESKSKVKEPYLTQDLWETIKGFSGITGTRPTKAHCIARAIQLVSSRGLEQAVPQQIISSLCVKGFLGDKFPKSLPSANDEITKEKGIFVLNQLFYDRITPSLNPAMSQLAAKRYQQTLQYFQQVFKDTGSGTGPGSGTKDPTSFKDIHNRSAEKFCAGERRDKKSSDVRFQSSDKALIQQMRAIVKSMLLRQLDHTAKVTLLLKHLFLLEKDKPIQIHPQVLEGGIPLLNKIGEQARDLLIQYYVNCEKSYGDGVALLEVNKKSLRPF